MKNLTNPGKDPVDNDFVEEEIVGGGTIQYHWHPDPELTDETKKADARAWRDQELINTDWVVPVTDHPQHAAYKTYRTKLRDWPSTSDFPDTRPTL